MRKIVLISLVFISCNIQTNNQSEIENTKATADTSPKDYVNDIKEPEDQSQNIGYDSLANIISKIRFYVQVDDFTDYNDYREN